MARSRNIKPGFFKNETLAECAPLARLLFAGLWCIADRAGRLEDRPKRIRAEILPYDDGSVDDMLNDLHKAGFILRYKVGMNGYIQVLNFDKHQNPHCRESESTIPAPDEHSACTVREQDEHRTGPADSLNLIPDSLNLIPEKTTCSPSASEFADDGFDRFWDAYGKKTGKQNAISQWKKIRPDAELLKVILQAAKACAGSYEPKFRKDPERWLKDRRWEDEIAHTSQPSKSLFVGASVGNLSGIDYTKGLADV
jgi:hypothetical protein